MIHYAGEDGRAEQTILLSTPVPIRRVGEDDGEGQENVRKGKTTNRVRDAHKGEWVCSRRVTNPGDGKWKTNRVRDAHSRGRWKSNRFPDTYYHVGIALGPEARAGSHHLAPRIGARSLFLPSSALDS
jgi:hypothetical protein